MGDFNVAHTALDVRVALESGERRFPARGAGIGSARCSARGLLVDVVRRLHPDTYGPYSWWSWLGGNAFNNDAGWRIDYHLATPGLARAALVGGTDRAVSYEARLSDHAPVVVDCDQ